MLTILSFPLQAQENSLQQNLLKSIMSGDSDLDSGLNFNNIPAGDYVFEYTTNSAVFPCPEESYQLTITVLDCSCPDVEFFNIDPLCNTSDILDISSIENTTEPGSWTMLTTPPGSNPGTFDGIIFNRLFSFITTIFNQNNG